MATRNGMSLRNKDAENMLYSYDTQICWSKMNWYTHNTLMSYNIQHNAALCLWIVSMPHNLWYSISFYWTRQKLHRLPRNSVEILQGTAEAPQTSMEHKAFRGVYPPALHATKLEFNWILTPAVEIQRISKISPSNKIMHVIIDKHKFTESHGNLLKYDKILAPICARNDNRRKWRHNTSISRSHDVTDVVTSQC